MQDYSLYQYLIDREGPMPVHLVGVRTQERFRLYLAGVMILAVCMFLIGLTLYFPFQIFALLAGLQDRPQLFDRLYSLMLLGSSILAMLWVLRLHGRDLMSVIAPGRGLDYGMFGRSALCFAFSFTPIILLSAYFGALTVRAPGWDLLIGLPVLLILTLFQASAEEIFCRGYLAQGFQIVTRNAGTAALAVALIFLLLHGTGDWQAEWGRKTAILTMSLAASYLVWRMGRLEPAMGLHFANNALVHGFLSQPAEGTPGITSYATDRLQSPPMDLGTALGTLLAFAAVASSYWFLGLQSGYIEHGWRHRGGVEEEE